MTYTRLATRLLQTARKTTHYTDANEQRLRRNQSTSALSIAEFALIHGNSTRLNASTDTRNVASNHDLSDRVRRAL
jgi:hypothetical protein